MSRQKSYKTTQKERVQRLRDILAGKDIYAYIDVDTLVEMIKEAAGNLRYDPFCKADTELDLKIIELSTSILNDKITFARREGADEERNRMD